MTNRNFNKSNSFVKKALLVSACFIGLVAATGANPLRGLDGYGFNKKEFVQDTVQVTLVTYETQDDFNKAYSKTNGENVPRGRELNAFATFNKANKTCEIHTIDPSVRYKPEFLGHELAHCFYGRWHR